jgi:TRAP-type uncharacterized transport system fused permease subunit
LFIYYYAILANLTPPVAAASLVASRIADSNYTKTALRAVRLGLPGFILPWIFIFNPELILEGSVISIILTTVSAMVGMLALAASSEGYLFNHMNIIERILTGGSGILMIIPGFLSDIAGYIIIVVIVLIQLNSRKKSAVKSAD